MAWRSLFTAFQIFALLASVGACLPADLQIEARGNQPDNSDGQEDGEMDGRIDGETDGGADGSDDTADGDDDGQDEPTDPPAAGGIAADLPRERFTHKFAPRLADSRISAFTENSYAILDHTVNPLNKLLVYLPGTNGDPTDFDRARMADVISKYGTHVLSIKYANENSAGNTLIPCVQNLGVNCHEPYRREMWEGTESSPYTNSTGVQDGIRTRLRTQLVYLAQTYPREGWGQYLSGGEVVWSKLTVMGHSAGAAMAGFIGKRVRLDRVIMLSGPYDSASDSMPAAWVSASPAAGATPINRFYSFTHESDAQYPRHVMNMEAMGLPAMRRLESLGGQFLPHRNFSSNNPNGGSAHNRTEGGLNTPRVGNLPVYDPLWRYMVTAP